ncbi:putative Src homology 3 domains containing protein [Trypoxylus dichotomus]
MPRYIDNVTIFVVSYVNHPASQIYKKSFGSALFHKLVRGMRFALPEFCATNSTQALRFLQVNPGSKAATKGIREGDVITSINGESTRDKTNGEAHALLKSAGNTLKLGLNQHCSGGSPKKRQYNANNKTSVQQETHSETIKRSNISTTTYIVCSSTTTTTNTNTTSKNQPDIESRIGSISFDSGTTKSAKENTVSNGIKINGDSRPNVKDYFSDRSTISSNYSSAASTPSTLTEYQVGVDTSTLREDRPTTTAIESDEAPAEFGNRRTSNCANMADKAGGNSRSKCRRRCTPRNNHQNNTGGRGKDGNNVDCCDAVRTCASPAIDVVVSDCRQAVRIVNHSERLCEETVVKIEDSVANESNYRVESPKTLPKKPRKGSVTKSRSLDDDDQIKIQELSESSENEEKPHPQCNAIIVEADSDEIEWESAKDLIIDKTIEEQVRTMTTETLKLEEKIPPKIISPEDESNLRYFLEGLNLVSSPEEAARKSQERQTAETIRAKRAKKREELAQYFLPVYQNPRFLDVISEEGSDLSDREQKDAYQSRYRFENVAPTPQKAVLTETDLAEVALISDTCTTSVAEANIPSDVEIVYLDTSDSDLDESEGDYADEEDLTSPQDVNDALTSQLTPPPTPDDVSPKSEQHSKISKFARKVIELICDENHVELRRIMDDARFKCLPSDLQIKISQLASEDIPNAPAQRLNVISPSVPSECSGDSSSRGTSLCTTIFKDEDHTVPQIFTLRELCLKKLITLPFGPDMLEELASVSKSLEELTNNLSSRMHVVGYHHSPAAANHTDTTRVLTQNDASTDTNSFELVSVKSKTTMPERAKDNREKWVGMPTEEDPQLIMCLSPTQKTFLESTKKVPDEAAKLLDLHEKFAKRRGYHEQLDQDGVDSSVSANTEMSNRLLAIIRESGGFGKNNTSATASANREDPNDYLYYVENRPKSSSDILLSNTAEEDSKETARLQARNLSEWLRLARDKSKSDPHLNIFNEMKEIVAINIPKNDPQIVRRRRSLPQEFYVQQMQYLIQKEKEIQQELEKIEEEKRKLTSEMNTQPHPQFDPSKYHISKNEDIAIHNDELATEKSKFNSKSTPSTERFRQEMYDEYMDEIAKRQDRQHNKVIKISSHQIQQTNQQQAKEKLEVTHVKGIEDEFMSKVKQRKQKYGLNSEDDHTSFERSDAEDSEPILVMDGDHLSDAKKLPKHLKEFIDITRQAAGALDRDAEDGIWSPGQTGTSSPESLQRQRSQDQEKGDELIPPVWTPRSAGSSPSLERKEFRPVNFESPVLGRRNKSDGSADSTPIDPPWKSPSSSSDIGAALASSLEKRIPNSYSAPTTGFVDFPSPRLPKAQNPTITLLQKARGGHLPKGAAYIDQPDSSISHSHPLKHDSPPKLAPGEVVYEIKNEYTSESESERPKKMADLSQRKYPMGIGPTTKDGMPLTLRSEVRDQNQSKWYKRMYDTIHKQKPRYDDDYVTVRYKQRRGRYPYSSGYLSEPEPGAYDSDASIYDHRITPLDRRRIQPAATGGGEGYTTSYTMPRSSTNSYAPQSATIKHGKDVYKNQPGRIENYVPGHSSISDKEAKEWWDEVMDIFDGWLADHSALPNYSYMLSRAITRNNACQSMLFFTNYLRIRKFEIMKKQMNHLEQQKQAPSKGYMSQALKESGYESDSTLIFRRRDEAINQLSPSEQREAYRTIQRGGDVPLHGLRKPAPERPKDDLDIEYIPISPNLTKIRVHKNTATLAYPIEIPPQEHIFANYKRTAPSMINLSKSLPSIPPSPPKRRSSRNNSTLRLISTMKVEGDRQIKRHETCFTSTSEINKSNVKFLRDKITCKLSPVPKRKGEARLRVTKTLTASPELKSKLTTSLAALKDPKTSTSRIYSKTNISSDPDGCCLMRSSSTGSVRKICRSCSTSSQTRRPAKSETVKSRAVSLDRTFGSEKRRVELTLPKSISEKRLIKSPDLVSPTEVKKASILSSIPHKPITKHSKATLASVKNGLRNPSTSHELPIKVSISEKGKELLEATRSSSAQGISSSKSLRSRSDSTSPAPSQASDRSKLSRSTTSLDSIKSSKSAKKVEKPNIRKTSSPKSIHLRPSSSKDNAAVLKKAKKDQLNDEIVKKEKKVPKTKIKSAGKISGHEPVKKVKNIEFNEDRTPITLSEIKRQKESVETDSFFQHLFLRNQPIPRTITFSNNSWITEKTLALQKRTCSISEPTIGALKIYLNHTKPVSDSKFRTMDAQLVRSRSVSPKNVRWEDENHKGGTRKAVAYERSSSLPPKLVFTETSRPISPIVQRRRQDTESKRTTIIRTSSPQKLVFTETTRPVSPVIRKKSSLKKLEREKRSPDGIVFSETSRTITPSIPRRPQAPETYTKYPERIVFTETIRPISPEIRSRSSSPKIERSTQRTSSPETLYFSQTTRPISPVFETKRSIESIPETIIRSPSYRKIKSLHGDSIDFIKKRIPRSRSAGEADERHFRGIGTDPPSLTQSTSSIDSLKEYQTYVKEIIHSAKKSDRFKELNKFYSTIERLGELERTTSSADLRPRRRDEEEIVDYDRWREVRQREKAEKELTTIYKELKEVQKEKDFLFMPKQVETYKWRKDFDRGLRIKERSVENIKEEFERLKLEEDDQNKPLDYEYKKDVYKPLWRGSSVINLARNMVEKRSQSEGRTIASRQRKLDTERLLTQGIGSRIWSSLSMEQVNILKNQLAEIYQNGTQRNLNDKPEYVVEVPKDKRLTPQTPLTVRRNSDSSKALEQPQKRTFQVGDSLLSETDKKRLSQSLSKEVLERQRQRYRTSLPLVLGKETRGAIAAAEAKVKHPEPPSPRTCYSLEMSEDGEKDTKKQGDSDFLLVLAKSDTANKANIKETLTEWAQPKKALISTDVVTTPHKTSSTSETESGSTDGSTKTVICVDKKEADKAEVKRKVQYFEKVREKDDYTPTVYKPADPSSPEELEATEEPKIVKEEPPVQEKATNLKRSSLSKSYQDFKELFGESDTAKVHSPISNVASSSFTSLKSLAYSTDSVHRSRSLSPHPDLYYFSLAKSGDVSKLKDKFERSHRSYLEPRRCSSDSQINLKSQIYIPGQVIGEVDNLRRRYEYPSLAGRGRSRIRRGGIVSPIHLKAEDRFMPHINIISKIASLYPRKSVRTDRERSTEELAEILGITVGEVKKLKRKFDSPDRNMSLLGHMFTSSPNLHELRDIAPYLTASWTAHRYPKKEDNTRPLTPPVPPPTLSASKSPPSVKKKPRSPTQSRPKSASPSRRCDKVKLSSILKPELVKQQEVKKNDFNPAVHQPVSRYQPQLPKVDPVRYRSWWTALPTQNRPTVTFKEPEPPIPPPKGFSRRATEAESPRRYVENEVTIHYKTPVRQEIKEALSEDELQRRQAEHMKRIYQEERRRKYLQELQDMNSRRHADNFIPSQKSPIPLNRYDDFVDDYSPKLKPRPRSPEPRLVAKALYNFVGQSARELTFRKGDIIYIRRQVDKNWYEGEYNAMVGLFPANYVEIVPYDGVKSTIRKPHEGQARAKYNFIAQTHLELSLAKGELVVITRRVDDNWFEGKIGGRKGIFPVSYVEVLIDPSDPPRSTTPTPKPAAAPAAHSLLVNGSLGGKESMGSHNYVPPYHTSTDSGPSYHAKPIQMTGSGTYGSLSRTKNLNQALHIETQSDPVPYRALYKYKPQNEDELELLEGDTVYVLEKCDDGWYVGSSERTGAFGTFPGNYVERI